MTRCTDPTFDRHGNRVDPTSFIHHRVSAEEDTRIIRAYLAKHFGELTTEQIRELDEIYSEAINPTYCGAHHERT